MTAQPTGQTSTNVPRPGPWSVSKWSGGEGHRPGWYVSRSRPDWSDSAVEWMKDTKRRIAWFPTEAAALAQAVQP